MSEPTQENFLDAAAMGPRRGERPLPEGARIATCKSCGAEIVWAHTEGERAIPLSLKTVVERDGIRYALTHFSDCPEAKAWSRSNKKAQP